MSGSRQGLPERCGRYVLFERLGGGGMAEVYKARIAQSSGPERILVIKRLPAGCGPQEAARFLEEAKIALPLTHGNITATFEFDRHEGRPFLVMEYVHGPSLRKVLTRVSETGREVSVPEALFICREVTRALRYAHNFIDVSGKRSPIVHRDVSPENVLISYSGQVKLTDFGIARALAVLDSGGVWGKPAYVAPEILGGHPGGPESDVYSLVSVLFEVLAGWPPLLANTEKETLERVRSVVPEPLSVYRDDLPDGLDDLVSRALDKAPERRGGGAAELEIALSRVLGAVAPHYTETDLAGLIVRLFEDELLAEAEDGSVAPDLAAQIRAQLEEAGQQTTGRESAAEMLAMGTVALGADGDAAPAASGPPGSAAAPSASGAGPSPAQVAVADLGQPSVGGALVFVVLGLSALIVGGILAFIYWRPPPPATPDARVVTTVQEDAQARTEEAGARRDAAAGADDAGTREAGRPRPGNGPRPPRRRFGSVTFNSSPWSFVYVDGSKLSGHTPIRDVKLRAGRHRVKFVNPELGLSKTVSLRLAPNESRFLKVRLTPPPE